MNLEEGRKGGKEREEREGEGGEGERGRKEGGERGGRGERREREGRGEGEREGREGRRERKKGERGKRMTTSNRTVFCVQNSFNRPIASVSHVHQPVRAVLVSPPMTVCSVPLALYKSSTMTDPRELQLSQTGVLLR